MAHTYPAKAASKSKKRRFFEAFFRYVEMITAAITGRQVFGHQDKARRRRAITLSMPRICVTSDLF